MSKHALDPRKRLKAAIYAASSRQGENAAQQQREHIESTLKDRECPWPAVKTYADGGTRTAAPPCVS